MTKGLHVLGVAARGVVARKECALAPCAAPHDASMPTNGQTAIELCHGRLFSLRANMPASAALDALRRMNIHGAPVLSDARAVGIVTLGDLVGDLGNALVADRMTQAVVAVETDVPVAEAAARMAHHSVHHLVVNRRGETVGFLSALDVVRALIGRPMRRPAELPA
jgi:predicted transcriptional regulator